MTTPEGCWDAEGKIVGKPVKTDDFRKRIVLLVIVFGLAAVAFFLGVHSVTCSCPQPELGEAIVNGTVNWSATSLVT